MDVFGEPLSDSEGAISVYSGFREEINILLLPTNTPIWADPSSHAISGSMDTVRECLDRLNRFRYGPLDTSAEPVGLN